VRLKLSPASAVYGLAFSAGCAWTGYLFLNSPGTLVQDEIGHFLISRNAWHYPELILDVWGRPVNTVLYMLPSIWGINAARAFSTLLAALTVLLTTKVAQRSGVQLLFLVPVFLWFQPWFNALSYTVITEVPFSLLLVLAVYLWLTGREAAGAVTIGLLPLVRHEGIVLVLAWCLYALYKRDWKAILISVSPFILYNLVYYMAFQRWAASIFLNPRPTAIYGSGSWLHFVQPVINNVGRPLVGLSLLGLIPVLRLKEKILGFALYALYFLTHVIIYRFGLYGSGGYDLFLLPLAPLFAVTATLGAEFALNLLSHTATRLAVPPVLHQVLPVLVIIVSVIWVGYLGLQTRPRALDQEAAALQQAANWLRVNGLSGNTVVATHVWFFYFYDLPLIPGQGWAKPPPPDQLDPGTIVVWDRHYSDRWGLAYNKLADPSAGWRVLNQFGDGFVVIFQKAQEQVIHGEEP